MEYTHPDDKQFFILHSCLLKQLELDPLDLDDYDSDLDYDCSFDSFVLELKKQKKQKLSCHPFTIIQQLKQ